MSVNNEILVEVKGVSKKFSHTLKQSMWYGFTDLMRSILGMKMSSSSLREGEFWAVKDIGFTLRRGECLGLIGHNGAGKSTLLKMLNGLIRPDEGSITMRGKVGALIELGAGFNPLLTGWENIYVNGQLLGFTKKEIDRKIGSIIDFADIGDFINSPVQNYSSGMKVRLGFAVAAHMEPDILLIDEVLAVGDMGFALKCFNKMDELLPKTAVIFVSHNMPQISRMCSSILLLKKGKTECLTSNISTGISTYYNEYSFNEKSSFSTCDAELTYISFVKKDYSLNENEIIEFNEGENFELLLDFKIQNTINKPIVELIFRDIEEKAFAEALNFRECLLMENASEKLRVKASFINIKLTQGVYSITVVLIEEKNKTRKHILRVQSAIKFKIISNNHGRVPIQFTPTWEEL